MYNKYFGFRELPFSVTPDPRFFYANSLYQEAFAALHYGISSKKGFIVITGEAGTGKTTLLRKLMRNLEVTTHSVFVFNTHLNFTELLELIPRELGLKPQENNELAAVEEINRYLIEQLRQRHIVALLIDEAQNLSDEVLEGLRLLSNLETDKEKLLQIVLMGQPELEAKLDQFSLRQLKQRVAIHCRLAPLEDSEIGSYINFRLQAAGYEGKELFDPEAIEYVAVYSGGIPRLINVICDNALISAYASSQKEVTSETIEEVARDLRLEKSHARPMEREPSRLKDLASNSKGHQIPRGERNQTFPKRAAVNSARSRSIRPRSNPIRPETHAFAWFGMSALTTLAILAGAGGAFYWHQGKTQLSNLPLNFKFEDLFSSRPETPEPSQQTARTPEKEPPAVASRIESSDLPSLPDKTSPVPEASKPASPPEPAPEKSLTAKANEKVRHEDPAGAAGPPPPQVAKDPNFNRRAVETQIQKAIRDRAINGIDVMLTNGTAYLDGRVDTERQRLAAERAARSVAEVRYVRNRIVVDSPLVDEDQDRRRIQLEIYKAIHNRAISGIEVSLINGIAYLDGRVDSERQRLAAERAARSVPEVRYVRNRIVVSSFLGAGGVDRSG